MPDGSMNVQNSTAAALVGWTERANPKVRPLSVLPQPDQGLSLRDTYGCYVLGDNMSPAYEQGDLLLVHPGRPVRAGDDVLLSRTLEDGGRQAIVRRLMRITATGWRVRQLNPDKVSTLSRTEWPKSELIVGKYHR